MNENVNKQLINNISLILKRSLAADATLEELRSDKKAGFSAVFKADSGFTCSANTFQPYVEEIADDFMSWQKTNSQTTLIALVKKIEQTFLVLDTFEKSYG